jgi:plasmid replication initiation protein
LLIIRFLFEWVSYFDYWNIAKFGFLPSLIQVIPIFVIFDFPKSVIMAKAGKKNLKPIRLIKKSNDLIEARHSLTTWEMRIFLKIVFLVNEEAHKGSTNFVIPIRELIKDFRLENSRQSYALFREARKALATRSIQLYQQNKDTNSWEMVNKSMFVETAHSVKMNNDGTISDDDDGYIRLQLHEQIKPYLLNINGSLDNNYTLFDRNYAIELPVKMLRFYLLLKRFGDTGFRQMTVEEIRDVFDLQDKYKSFGNIKQRIIDKAQVELAEKTDIRFEYQEVKKVGTKTVVAVKFKIYPNQPTSRGPFENDKLAALPSAKENRVGDKPLVEKDKMQKFDTHFDTYFMLMREYGVSASTLTQWLRQYAVEHIEQCWKDFLIKTTSGRIREKEKEKQGGYLRVLIEQADFSEKQKKEVTKTENTTKIKEQAQQVFTEIERKKVLQKQEFEREAFIAQSLLSNQPDLEQEILNQINHLDQTAYTTADIQNYPFLKPKIIFRLKQQFSEKFK